MKDQPDPISAVELESRLRRVMSISVDLGFVGTVEYRHVYSKSGGAQYGLGRTAEQDLLTVYAEAFDKDADPEDFSLTAILAHERGHQILVRHARIAKRVSGRLSGAGEEITAECVSGAAVLYRSFFLRALRQIDERYGDYGSSIDLCAQVRRASKKIVILRGVERSRLRLHRPAP